MDIQLTDRIVLQLQEIAREQDRPISDILQDAIAEYVARHTDEAAFREQVRAALVDHAWLLDELDKR